MQTNSELQSLELGYYFCRCHQEWEAGDHLYSKEFVEVLLLEKDINGENFFGKTRRCKIIEFKKTDCSLNRLNKFI